MVTKNKGKKAEFRFVENADSYSRYDIIWLSGNPIVASVFEAGVYEQYRDELARLRAENVNLKQKVKELEDALRTT